MSTMMLNKIAAISTFNQRVMILAPLRKSVSKTLPLTLDNTNSITMQLKCNLLTSYLTTRKVVGSKRASAVK